MPGTLREVVDNDITPRDKISLNELGITKDKYESVYMMMIKTGLEVSHLTLYLTTDPQDHINS